MPEQHYDKIYRYCYFKVKDRHLAEDLTQETFLRFFDQRNYINRGKPLAYLYTIARNLCIDAFRKKATQALPDEMEDTGAELPDDAIALRQALQSLPPETQELLLLRYANELSMRELSALTGLSRFALRRKINGALAALRQWLGQEDV